MSIDTGHKLWKYISDPIYMGNKRLEEIWVGNNKVYPEGSPGGLYKNKVVVFNDAIYAWGFYDETRSKVNSDKLFKFKNNRWDSVCDIPYDISYGEEDLSRYTGPGERRPQIPKATQMLVYNNCIHFIYVRLVANEHNKHYSISVNNERYYYAMFNYDYVNGFIQKESSLDYTLLPLGIFGVSNVEFSVSAVYDGTVYFMRSVSSDITPGGNTAYLYRLNNDKTWTNLPIRSASREGVDQMFVCNGSLYVTFYSSMYSGYHNLYKWNGSDFDLVFNIYRKTDGNAAIVNYNNNIYCFGNMSGDGGYKKDIHLWTGSGWDKIGNMPFTPTYDNTFNYVTYHNLLYVFYTYGYWDNHIWKTNTHCYTWDGVTWIQLNDMGINE